MPWRTGRKVGNTIYYQEGPEASDEDEFVGSAVTAYHALLIVDTANAAVRQRERLEALEEIRQRAIGEWVPLGADSHPYWWQAVSEEAEDISPEVAAVLWPEDPDA